MALSRKQKRWLIIFGSVILLIITLILFANIILSNKADSLIRKELTKLDMGEQVIDFEKIKVNIFSRSVKISGISISPTETALDKVKRSQLAKPTVGLNLREIKISGVNLIKVLRGNTFSVRKIALKEPLIEIYGNGNPLKGNHENDNGSNNKGSFSLDTILISAIKEAWLGSFEINNASVIYKDLASSDTMIKTTGISLLLDQLWLYHPEGDTGRQVLDIDDIEIEIGSHMMHLPGGFYTLESGKFGLNYADKNLKLDSLYLRPAYGKGVFGRKFGKQTDRFDISVANIDIKGIEFDSILSKKFIASQLILTQPSADIFRDKNVERDLSIFPKLFQTAIAQLPIEVYLPSVKVTDGYVNYQEVLKDSENAGGVILEQLEMNITGISNHPDSIKKGQVMHVDARALLMGAATMQVFFYLPIGNHAEYFTFHGSTGAFPASALNPLLAPLAFVDFTGGNIKSTRFYAMAMNDTTAGRLEFLYDDLIVNVLKKGKERKDKEQENKFLSFLARTAVHKNNPHAGNLPRIAKMSFIRDRNKGFFNYVWKTIQDGLIITLTPGKKRLASEMGWTEFQSSWRENLLNDWNALQVKNRKKKH